MPTPFGDFPADPEFSPQVLRRLFVFRRRTVANKEHSSSETKSAEINMEEKRPFKLNMVRGGNEDCKAK